MLSPSAKWLADIMAFVQAPEGLENRAKLEVGTALASHNNLMDKTVPTVGLLPA